MFGEAWSPMSSVVPDLAPDDDDDAYIDRTLHPILDNLMATARLCVMTALLWQQHDSVL